MIPTNNIASTLLIYQPITYKQGRLPQVRQTALKQAGVAIRRHGRAGFYGDSCPLPISYSLPATKSLALASLAFLASG